MHSQKERVGPAFLVEGREAVRCAVCKGVALKLGKASNRSASNELQPEDTAKRMQCGKDAFLPL